MLYFRAGLWYQFFLVRVFGADFWFWYVCHGHKTFRIGSAIGTRERK